MARPLFPITFRTSPEKECLFFPFSSHFSKYISVQGQAILILPNIAPTGSVQPPTSRHWQVGEWMETETCVLWNVATNYRRIMACLRSEGDKKTYKGHSKKSNEQGTGDRVKHSEETGSLTSPSSSQLSWGCVKRRGIIHWCWCLRAGFRIL